ncbi:hypothetical protein LSCM1_08111 [Leishmania martiniquensis]|uniref:YbaK/aminoacyl-tRNA synthetase-associated domain-containing protein n=1 Tax=Leishmania martiniquensis TaxID=1580590 RepID=A0A836KYL7_9TRYP|nr:hypothetical protein LSCM1_08111 [Leishmania martiniquensis]
MERCKQHFIAKNAPFLIERIQAFSESTATVELAAVQLRCEPSQIAKSLCFSVEGKAKRKAEAKTTAEGRKRRQDGSEAEGCEGASPSPATAARDASTVVIVAAGDAKVSAKKYREKFACQPKMLRREEVEPLTGFPPGGVAPFGLRDDVKVYLDVSLKRFLYVYPAAGTTNTGIKVTPDELEQYASNVIEWVNLCDGWQPETAAAAAIVEKAIPDGSRTTGVVENADIAAKKAENEASKSAEAGATS